MSEGDGEGRERARDKTGRLEGEEGGAREIFRRPY